MSERAVQPVSADAIRVAVIAPEPQQRRKFEHIVSTAGHVPVATTEEANIVLSVERSSDALDEFAIVLRTDALDRAAVLPEQATPAQIDAAVRAVAVGLIVRAGAAFERGFERVRSHQPHPLLSPRELEILTAISDGASNKAIARQLAISQHTVKFHIESLFRKLNVRTRAEAVAKGIERRSDERVEV
jgi:two-component system, NarL family, nitrate/nitrite response regulator NarL